MLNLSGKNILVTGASKRTGRGIALKLAAHGATIAIHYQSSHKKAQEVVKLIETNQGKAFAFQARLQSPFAVKKMVEKINQKLEVGNMYDIKIDKAYEYDVEASLVNG